MAVKKVGLIEYSPWVDFWNSATHAVGAVAAAAGLVVLLLKAEGLRELPAVLIYGLSMIAVYSISAFYHGLPLGELKRRARLADHTAIPVLIAGTATPCALITLFEASTASALFVFFVAWGCAAFGVISKLFFFEKLKAVTMAVYIISCILMLGCAVPLLGEIDKNAFNLLLYGNLTYVVGAICCWLGIKREWFHVVFHLFVLAAGAIHFYAIYNYVL